MLRAAGPPEGLNTGLHGRSATRSFVFYTGFLACHLPRICPVQGAHTNIHVHRTPYTNIRNKNCLLRRVLESTTLRLTDEGSFLLNIQWPTRRVGELSATCQRIPDSPSQRIGDSPSQNQNGSKCCVRDICRTDLCKKPLKIGLIACHVPLNLVAMLIHQTKEGRPGQYLQKSNPPTLFWD